MGETRGEEMKDEADERPKCRYVGGGLSKVSQNKRTQRNEVGDVEMKV